MELMNRWFQIASASMQPTYHGIPVFMDNAYFPCRDGALSDRVADNNWFIAGPFDTGSSSIKVYSWWGARGIGTDSAWRTYDDITGDSSNWWSSTFADGTSSESDCTTNGRYVYFSVYKPLVDQLYLKQGDTYLFKGAAV